jgi:hypothetical protein
LESDRGSVTLSAFGDIKTGDIASSSGFNNGNTYTWLGTGTGSGGNIALAVPVPLILAMAGYSLIQIRGMGVLSSRRLLGILRQGRLPQWRVFKMSECATLLVGKTSSHLRAAPAPEEKSLYKAAMVR